MGCLSCDYLDCSKCFPGYFRVEGNCQLHCPPNYSEDTEKWLCLPLPNPYKGVNVTAVLEQTNSVLLNFSQVINPQLQFSSLLLFLSDTDSNEYNFTATMAELVANQTYNLTLVVNSTYLPANNELSISLLNPHFFLDVFGNHLLTTHFVIALHPIGSGTDSKVYTAKVSTATAAVTTSASVGGVAASVLSSNPMSLFTLINSVQMITYFPLATLSLPNSLKARMVSVNLQSYFSNPFTISTEVEGRLQLSTPDFARSYGYESAAFLSNAGVIVASFAFSLGLIPIFLAASKCKSQTIAKYFATMVQGFRWRNLIMHLIEAYLDLCIAAFLQLRVVSSTQLSFSQPILALNSILGCLFAGLCCAFPLFLAFAYNFSKSEISIRNFEKIPYWKFLYEGFKSTRAASLYYFLFVFRRLVYSLTLIFLNFYPIAQVLITAVHSFIVSIN